MQSLSPEWRECIAEEEANLTLRSDLMDEIEVILGRTAFCLGLVESPTMRR